jgi:hypothetical protein
MARNSGRGKLTNRLLRPMCGSAHLTRRSDLDLANLRLREACHRIVVASRVGQPVRTRAWYSLATNNGR